MPFIFYDHLVYKTEIFDFIDKLEEADNQKGKAKQLVDDIIHQGVMEFILEKLHPGKHQTFLSQVEERPYDPEIINYLKEHISPEVEAEIADHVKKLIEDIKKDLLISSKK